MYRARFDFDLLRCAFKVVLVHRNQTRNMNRPRLDLEGDAEIQQGEDEQYADEVPNDPVDIVPSVARRDVRDELLVNLEGIKQHGTYYACFRPYPGALNPGLVIEGLRQFSTPLLEHDIQAIIAESHRAPYGKGTETLVNEDVRKTWEIDGSRVKLTHPEWPYTLDGIVRLACDQMGIPQGTVEAQLYKLLVYEVGAMFRPHKD